VTFEFNKRIPVSVVGSFLGAGKTTLVNHLIACSDYRFGVIINEFGETGVDGSLIEAMDSDGVAALIRLAMRETPPEYVLIELSGVADPVPVAQTILDPMLKPLFELDGILGVADARNLITTLQQNPEGAVQLAYASAVILNKVDRADSEARTEAKSIIRQLNPLASILEGERGAVDPRLLLNTHAFEPRWDTDYKSRPPASSIGWCKYTLAHENKAKVSHPTIPAGTQSLSLQSTVTTVKLRLAACIDYSTFRAAKRSRISESSLTSAGNSGSAGGATGRSLRRLSSFIGTTIKK
jgi:G3E family GTPase